MTKLLYNPNNTEGHHQTSFDFIDTEIRKDDKIVATDLVDLYDVELTNLQHDENLIYDSNTQKWINGHGIGTGCDLINEDTNISVGNNGDFDTLDECFVWLRKNCKVIKESATLYIILLNSINILKKTSLNHPYGHRIVIDGQSHIIRTHYDDIVDNIIELSNNHSIKLINMYINSMYIGGISKYYNFFMNDDSQFSPHIRSNFLTTYNDELYSFGGVEYDGSGNLANNGRIVYKCTSVLYSNWELFDTNMPINIIITKYCVNYNNKIYLLNNMGNGFDIIKIYDFNTNSWSEENNITGDIPPSSIFIGYTVTLYNDKIYLIGGSQGTSSNSNIYIYDITLKSWSIISSIDIGIGYINHSSCLYNDNIYIYGGRNVGQDFNNGLLKLDLIANTITTLIPNTTYAQGTTTPFVRGLMHHNSYIHNDIMYIYFGVSPVVANPNFKSGNTEIYTYDIINDVWDLQEETVYKGVGDFGFTVNNNISYVFGGYRHFSDWDHDYRYPFDDLRKIHNEEKVFKIDGKPSSEFNIINTNIYSNSIDIMNNSCLSIDSVNSVYIDNNYKDPITKYKPITIEYHKTYIIALLYINLFGIKNNSILLDNNSEGYINSLISYNSSTHITPINQAKYTLNDNSVVITNDITKFNDSYFTNSKLIEKK